MNDAAAKFYARSHEVNTARRKILPMEASTYDPRGHRYGAAYEYLRDNPGQKALEMGYGGGEMVPLIASVCREYHLIDIIDRTEGGALPENARATVGNLDNDFPFESGAFDTVLAMMIIEHLYDPFHAFAELARVLRPGGRAFVNLPNIASLRCRLQLLRGQMPITSSQDWFEKREWDGNHLHFFTVADTRRIAELNGLKMTHLSPVGKGLFLKGLKPDLFCHEITYVFEK